MPKHLWEFDHPYYGADGYESQLGSFAQLRAAIEATDEDMNLVYRFDWHDDSQPHRADLFLDEDDRSGQTLTVYALMPRKSAFISWSCPIAYDQENEVIAWLRGPRCLGHLQKLWAPLLGDPARDAPTEPGPERNVAVDVRLDEAAIRTAIGDTVRRAVAEHRQRWYAQGWHDAEMNRG